MNNACIQYRAGDQDREIIFPDSGNIAWHITNILSGKDYPLLEGYLGPANIIDIGANVGATAIFFANAYPSANIFSFEPSPSNFAYLQKNVEGIPNIKASNVGLSDCDSQVKLYLGLSQCLQHSLIPSCEIGENFEIVTIKQASVALQEVGPGRNMLKVDTEGCEVQILSDLADFLHSVDVIYLEYHSESDRLKIDNLLTPMFSLWHSTAHMVHRGNSAYLSQNLLSQFPDLGKFELKS